LTDGTAKRASQIKQWRIAAAETLASRVQTLHTRDGDTTRSPGRASAISAGTPSTARHRRRALCDGQQQALGGRSTGQRSAEPSQAGSLAQQQQPPATVSRKYRSTTVVLNTPVTVTPLPTAACRRQPNRARRDAAYLGQVARRAARDLEQRPTSHRPSQQPP